MVSRPLIVASVAGALLLTVVGVDLAMDRTYYLDIEIGDRWVTFGEFPYQPTTRMYSGAPQPVDPNGTVTVRVRGENGYPWGMSEPYTLSVGASVVGEGTLAAPAWGTAQREHAFSASVLYESGDPYATKPVPGATPRSAVAWFRLQIDGGYYEQTLFVEAPR